MKAAASLIRPVNVIFTALITGAFCMLASPHIPFSRAFLAAVCSAFVAVAGNCINDLSDITTDRINKPGRPLPSGALSPGTAFTIYYLSVTASIILALQISLPVFALVLLTNVLLLLYAQKLRKNVFTKNITIAAIGGLLFLYAGLVCGNVSVSLIPALFAFLTTLLRELLKDIADEAGDRKAGYDSVPIHFGLPAAIRLIWVYTVLTIGACAAAYYLHFLSIYFFIPAMIVVCPLLLSVARDANQRRLPALAGKLSSRVKLTMLFGFIAILAGL
jgi:geranylgeranylglycerol-phosphate geranylgeranyltransferase